MAHTQFRWEIHVKYLRGFNINASIIHFEKKVK
jgi:hypothetical protein